MPSHRNRSRNPLDVGAQSSLILQVGKSNQAFAVQTGVQPGFGVFGTDQNSQVTAQFGTGNFAYTAQTANATSGVSNTSFTQQFGSHNVAITAQK